jgi:hypothetical protein
VQKIARELANGIFTDGRFAVVTNTKKTALERESLTRARQALVDWVVNVAGVEASVALTIEIENALTHDEFVQMLERMCNQFMPHIGVARVHSAKRQILKTLDSHRPAFTQPA